MPVLIEAKPPKLWITRGGPTSGHFGHEGRPGQVGGSLPSEATVEVNLADRASKLFSVSTTPPDFIEEPGFVGWMTSDGAIHRFRNHLEGIEFVKEKLELPGLPFYDNEVERTERDLGIIRMTRESGGIGATFYVSASVTEQQIDTLVVLAGGLSARDAILSLWSDLPGIGHADHEARVAEAEKVLRRMGEPPDVYVTSSLLGRGGPTSGHYGHEGRPGQVGGSQPSPGGPEVPVAEPTRPPARRQTRRRKTGLTEDEHNKAIGRVIEKQVKVAEEKAYKTIWDWHGHHDIYIANVQQLVRLAELMVLAANPKLKGYEALKGLLRIEFAHQPGDVTSLDTRAYLLSEVDKLVDSMKALHTQSTWDETIMVPQAAGLTGEKPELVSIWDWTVEERTPEGVTTMYMRPFEVLEMEFGNINSLRSDARLGATQNYFERYYTKDCVAELDRRMARETDLDTFTDWWSKEGRLVRQQAMREWTNDPEGFTKRWSALQTEFDQVIREREAMLDQEGSLANNPEFIKLDNRRLELNAEMQRLDWQRDQVFNKVDDFLVASFGHDPEETTKIDPSYDANVPPDVQEKWQRGVAFFNTLWDRNVLGVDADRITFRVTRPTDFDPDRGFYEDESRTVAMSAAFNESGAVHELGHWSEGRNAEIHDLAMGFLMKRAEGKPMARLRDITGNQSFKPNEMAFVGAFKGDAYAAKWYGQTEEMTTTPATGMYKPRFDNTVKASEVISQGLDRLEHSAMSFYEDDPEYFKFIVGLLRGDLLED